MNIYDLEREADITLDEQGRAVIKIPLHLWNDFKAQQTQISEKPVHQNSQVERILALMDSWKEEPNDTPSEWSG
jgi:hypothetical protein